MCRGAGIRITPQRTEILRCLAGSGEHPDAETIHTCVRRVMPAVSLDTVYRTLRLFEAKGVIVKLGVGGDRARFDANISQHHHFVCTQCGLVRDFYDDQFNTLKPPRAVAEMGDVASTYVELRGVCLKCRKKQRKVSHAG
ncbi:MAG: Fur family transcriptional regulator [Lentisphaeria bacterium]|nr:Fur family transcriptional regulator [Lentisphaeria bacterium]